MLEEGDRLIAGEASPQCQRLYHQILPTRPGLGERLFFSTFSDKRGYWQHDVCGAHFESIHTHKTQLETRLGVNLSKSGPKRGAGVNMGFWVGVQNVTLCDLLCQVASSVGGVEDLVIEY